MRAGNDGYKATRAEDRWSVARYGVAALAVGAGLATGAPSEAAVVYTNPDPDIQITDGLLLDLNNDGTPDFYFWANLAGTDVGVAGYYWYYGGPNGVAGFKNYAPGYFSEFYRADASALPAGTPIPNGLNFYPYGYMLYPDSDPAPWDPLAPGDKRYLGLRFNIPIPGAEGGTTHYGWAGIIKGNHLDDYAYQTDPDTPITTGQQVPEPASLLLMAAGATAVVAYRRWRRE